MPRIRMIAVCMLASAFSSSPAVSVVPAMAHDRGGGHDGGDRDDSRDGGLGSELRDGSFGFTDHRDGVAVRSDRVANRFDNRRFFDYPEWAYDHQEHPFRSPVCSA
ncbi:hypothetical protein JNB88_24845 [Rhizobium cauense]|uniref:hypothetical protein n=1 Tax=Rhizobium cauense TaxID=1166683 RepID=UPI001C6E16F6|nr:hypothetical protein [Rhizobium cauense]MBW9116859.1 hypothetical protein [Rhizobium cauense]